MNLHIDKKSDLPAYEQLREQIIFLISTGEIRIGDEMPSVRGLARQLGVSSNTVSKVYSGLVRGGWLVDHPGSHHMVVRRRQGEEVSLGLNLDELIDRTIELAVANGYSLQQLTDHVRKRLLEQPPDHLLIVEPDEGIGEIMQEEIEKKTGFRPPRCSLTALQQNPALGIGALLIVPLYIAERLCQLAVHRTRIIGASYSPLDTLTASIDRLSRPSIIGWVSVSAAGLKTISGMVAPVISNRHSSHLFLLERTGTDEINDFIVRRFQVGNYRPSDILNVGNRSVLPGSNVIEPRTEEQSETISVSDLLCMDLLFLDSVTARHVQHPNAVVYELLSKNSLQTIEAAVKNLK